MNTKFCITTLIVLLLLTSNASKGGTEIPPLCNSRIAEKRPKVVRLDQQVDKILSQDNNPNQKQELLREHFEKHLAIYSTLGHGDPAAYANFIVSGDNEYAKTNQRTCEYFAGRDLTKEIEETYLDLMNTLNSAPDNPPQFYLAYGFKRGTNARTEIGQDGNPRILLNLNALAQPSLFETAVRHELVHATKRKTLLEISMNEGVACWISFTTRTDIKNNNKIAWLPWNECLFWSKDEYMTAVKLKSELLEQFAKVKDQSDSATLQSFLDLNQKPNSIPNAPSRSGYFIGLLAVQAWVTEHPDATLADLLEATPRELWDALQQRQ